ncbi:kinase-like domain-containing protein [Endogone sp. FLAS-F59071]|nr:kinase-like domain-containing protein [Endogone sp. FLAS-F59071]|eukprot:RUS18233.1 kinase-like domain-containing protein [Endogone sp. FLAS-F59071]
MNPSTLNQILSDSLYSIGYSDLRLPNDAVKLHEVVGIGAFGVVRRGTHKGKTVAVKEIMVERLTPQEVNETVHNELKTLYRLRNHKDSVTQLIGYYGFGPTVSIVLSYAENGDLKRYLVNGELKGDWSRKASICADIAKALDNIHKENIAHGDLKAANILLDQYLKPKITDFGVSKSLTSLARGKPLGHTLRYVAPERLERKWGHPPTHEQCVQSDIFGYGMIMWEVATDGKLPYGDADDRVGVKICKSWYQKEDHLQNVGVLPDDVPQVFRAMVCNCLQWEPLGRMPLKAVYEALDAYVRTAPPPLDSSPQIISKPQYTRPQSMLDRLQAAKDLFAANFDMTDPRTKMNIKVNKINFPKGETILRFHLEKLGLSELAHCLAWIDFSRFSDITPLGRTVYRGTVTWERSKHAYIKQRRQTPPEPFIAYDGEDVQHHYALKEVNLASKAEVCVYKFNNSLAGSD